MKVPGSEFAVIRLDAPVLPAYEAVIQSANRRLVWCKHCQTWHRHGPAKPCYFGDPAMKKSTSRRSFLHDVAMGAVGAVATEALLGTGLARAADAKAPCRRASLRGITADRPAI